MHDFREGHLVIIIGVDDLQEVVHLVVTVAHAHFLDQILELFLISCVCPYFKLPNTKYD